MPSLSFTTKLELVGQHRELVRPPYEQLLTFEVFESETGKKRLVVWHDAEKHEILKHIIPKGIIPYTFHCSHGHESRKIVAYVDEHDGQPIDHCLSEGPHDIWAVPKYTFPSIVASEYFQARVRARQLLRTFDVEAISRRRHFSWRGSVNLAHKQQIKIWRRNNTDRNPSFTFFAHLSGHPRHYEFDIRCLRRVAECPSSNQLVLKLVNQHDLDEQDNNEDFPRTSSRRRSATSLHQSPTPPDAVIIHAISELKLPRKDVQDWETIHITFNESGDAKKFAQTCLQAKDVEDATNPPPPLPQPPQNSILPTEQSSSIIEQERKRNHAAEDWWKRMNDNRNWLFPPLSSGDPRVKIAVVDTGIDATNPYIQKNWLRKARNLPDQGYRDFLNDMEVSDCLEENLDSYNREAVKAILGPLRARDRDMPMDPTGHGTHVAGIVLQLVPEATLFVARVLREDRKNYDNGKIGKKEVCRAARTIALSILYAVEIWQVKIITLSIGLTLAFLDHDEKEIVRHALDYAKARKVIVFAAGSNSANRDVLAFPASEEEESRVICVNSSNGDGEKSHFNHPAQDGGYDNFSILGEYVKSTWIQNCDSKLIDAEGIAWKHDEGTSIATPIAACVAALVIQFGRQFGIRYRSKLESREGIRRILKKMATEAKEKREWDIGGERKKNFGFYDIVPWTILNSKHKAMDIKGAIEWELRDEVI